MAKGDIARVQKKSWIYLLSYSPGDSTRPELVLRSALIETPILGKGMRSDVGISDDTIRMSDGSFYRFL